MSPTLRERFEHGAGFAAQLMFSWQYWTVISGAVLLFTVTGPFGTYDATGFWMRLLYWGSTMLGTSLVAIIVVAGASAAAPPEWRTSFLVLIAGSLVSCLPNTLLVATWAPLFLDVPPSSLGRLFLSVLPIGLAVGVVIWLVFETTGRREGKAATPNPLVDRLPVEKRGPVVRMSMQDHYVEVVTVKGRELVLMRMGDAAAAMGEAGLRIHRSHWVSRDHVVASRREGAQAVVTTSDGVELPVSRSYVAGLRTAGLL